MRTVFFAFSCFPLDLFSAKEIGAFIPATFGGYTTQNVSKHWDPPLLLIDAFVTTVQIFSRNVAVKFALYAERMQQQL